MRDSDSGFGTAFVVRRVGRRAAIAAVVEEFYGRVLGDAAPAACGVPDPMIETAIGHVARLRGDVLAL